MPVIDEKAFHNFLDWPALLEMHVSCSRSLSRGRYGTAPVHVEPTRDDPRQSWFFDTASRASSSGVDASDIRHQPRPLADVASP